MENPKVSIISVCYNILKAGRKAYFKQMLESVENQTYKNIEHVIVDGKSNDGSVEYIKKLIKGKKNVKFISEKDSGIYDAMNKGGDLASGKYIAFLNSDDFYDDKKGVEETVKYLEKKQADYSYGDIKVLPLDASKKHKVVKAKLANFIARMPFGHQSYFLKRDIFIKEGKFDEKTFKSSADYDLIVRVILKGYKGVFVPINFVSFREGGFSHENDFSFQEVILSVKKNCSKYGVYSDSKWEEFVRKKRLPLNVLLKLLVNKDNKIKLKFFFEIIKIYIRKFLKFLFILNFGKNTHIKILGITVYKKRKK